MEPNVLSSLVTRSDLTASSNFLGAPTRLLGTQRLRKEQLDWFMDITDEGLTLALFSRHSTESEA